MSLYITEGLNYSEQITVNDVYIKLKDRALVVYVLCVQLQLSPLLGHPLFKLFYIQHKGLSNVCNPKI